MKTLALAVRWELLNQFRNHIMTVALVVTLLYLFLFSIIPLESFDHMLGFLIFSDPAMLGFMFVGVLILVEKGTGTLDALSITPMRPWHYLWAKALSLTLIAIPCSLAMALIGHEGQIGFASLTLSVVYASLLFVFIGFIGVSRTQTLNQYIIIIPLFLTPMLLPALNYVGWTDSWLWYLIPSQGPLILLEAAFGQVGTPDLIYAIVYPPLGIAALYFWALHAYNKHILSA